MPNDDYDSLFDAAGRAYNVDPQLAKTVFHLESSGNPATADSSQGAEGGMQMLPSTAAALGVTDPRNMTQAIPAATAYLAQGLQATGTPAGALAYYHGGPDTSQWGPKTAAYVAKGRALYPQMALTPPAQPSATITSSGSNPIPIGHADERFPPAPAPTVAGATSVASPQAVQSQSGEDILSSYAAPATAPQSPTPPSASTSSLGEDILGAYSSAAAPAMAGASNDNAVGLTGLPAVDTFFTGVKHGLQSVPNTINRVAAYVDSKVPALAQLDASAGQDPQKTVAAMPAAEAAYQAQVQGHPYASGAGNFLGQAAVAAPLLGAITAPVGIIGGALAEGVGGAATGVGRGAQAATNLLTGTAVPGAGVLSNALTLAAGNSLQGAGFNALTGGNPVQGAEAGAVLGPLAGVAVAAGKGVSTGVGALVNKLMPSRAAADVNTAFDAAIARSKGGNLAPVVPVNKLTGAPAEPLPPPSVTPLQPSPGPSPAATPSPAPVAPVQATPLPAPNSAGAAATTPSDLAANAMTPAQAEASRATGFNYRLAQQANTGFDDANYVPGSNPTPAEASADPELAHQQRVLATGNSEAAALDRSNNEARLDFFDSLAGTPTTVETMQAARSAQAQQDLAAAWQNKQPADAQPVMDQINAVLAGPDGKRQAVANTMQNVAGALQKADGNGLETDPEMLYGVRQHVTDLMSKQGQADNPMSARATSQLQGVKDALDAAIEPASPGYQQYLSNYSAASRPIDAQQFLQSYRPNLMDAKGNIQLNRVNTMMKSIGQNIAAPGINPAKSLPDDTVDQLFNLRQDLLRQGNRDIARQAGSNTSGDLSVMSQMGQNALTMGAHAVAAHVPGGNLLLSAALNNASNASNSVAQRTLANRLFTPVPTSAAP